MTARKGKHAPWCARYMACTCMAPGGPSTSASERLSWVLQRYDEGRRVSEATVRDLRSLRAAAEKVLLVLVELEESSTYWSEYDVPLGLEMRVRNAREILAGAVK